MAEPPTTDLTSSGEGPPWLTPGVRGIGAASLLADLGHEIPTALLPSLLTSTLGAPASALGLIEGVSDALAGATRFAGGPLADDPHRRRTAAVGGYAGTAILSGLVGVATSVWQVGVLRAGAWAARGLRVPSRNALLADVVTPGMYGRAYGFERAMDNLGAIGGPLLALALIAVFSVRTAILLSIIPGLLAVLAIVYAIRHTPKPTEKERQPLRFKVRPVLRGRLGRFLGGVTLFEAANMAATLMILRASDLLAPTHGQQRATEIAIVSVRALQRRGDGHQHPGRLAWRPSWDGARVRGGCRMLRGRVCRVRVHRREHLRPGWGFRGGWPRDRTRRDCRACRSRRLRPERDPRLRLRPPRRNSELREPRGERHRGACCTRLPRPKLPSATRASS